MLLIGVAAAVAVLAVVVTVAVLPDARRGVPAPDRPGPVLLVPGYGGGTGGIEALAQRIRATGRDATVVVPPGDGTGDLNRQADRLDEEVERLLRAGAPSVDLVGYSAGGVVVRLWVQNHDGVVKARRVVTLGSPHHGAEIAGAGAAAAAGACPQACQQLAPGSRLLRGLSTPVPTPPQWLAVWTARDRTVTPPESARLEGATNVELQVICPSSTLDHAGLPTDPTATALVLQAIGVGPIQPPNGCVSS